jgi:hypothetical protein
VCTREPLGRNTGRLGRAGDSAQKPNSNKKTFFFFKTILQITNQFEFKSNLNFNDFYSRNKIQEHFITPRKICNGMNATNNYLFKYIALQNSILFRNQGITERSATRGISKQDAIRRMRLKFVKISTFQNKAFTTKRPKMRGRWLVSKAKLKGGQMQNLA